MSTVHMHLLLNHFPVIGAVIGLLLLAFAAWRGGPELLRATFALYVLLAVVAVVVYLTGEPAEDAVEKLPGFSDALVERHEEIALISTIAMGIAGLLALVALFVQRKRVLPPWVARGGVVVGIGVVALMGYTANLGGQIRHTEIRGPTPATSQTPAAAVEGEHGER
jgi:MFS family permease